MRMGRVLRNDTFTAEDVRTELYQFLNDLREQQNHHSIAWSKHSDGHPDNCYVCRDYGIRREAVKAAIKRFGGSPGKRW